jgi:phosphoribosylformimino-5-aminoimidazole carboxamide ribotide isomerase
MGAHKAPTASGGDVIARPGAWTVYPAIDLRRGQVVRLMQGDPDQQTTYADDPLSVARRWQEAGATWLHVVNLDGAFGERSQENQAALERILTTGLKVQFGGGVRDFTILRRALDLGVSRVVIGTAAVKNPELVDDALRAFGPERVALGIDAREGQVRTHGWQEAAATTALELATHWATRGVRWIVFTDVSRDGMGSGLNLEATVQLAQVIGPSASSGQAPSASSGQAPSTSSGQAPSTSSGQAPSAGSGQAPSAGSGQAPSAGSGQAPSASQRGELVEPSGQAPSAGARRRLHVIASGGVASLADVRQAYQAGLSGVIIGRALYEGQVVLEEALRVGTAMAWMKTWNVGSRRP